MPFPFQCPHCKANYTIKEKVAGKRTKCKKCEGVMTLTPPEPETSEGGSQRYRHQTRERDFEFNAGEPELIEAISDHLEQHLGESKGVFHELVSDMIHLDVHAHGPTEQYPWQTLVTSGMSERPMTVPPDAGTSDYAELLVCLPNDWPLTSEAFKDENFYWPVRWLKNLARLPHEFESWLGNCHTIPNGDPAEPFASRTNKSGWIVFTPVWFDEAFHQLRLDDGRQINFLAIVPLDDAEMNFKLKKGAEKLIDKLCELSIEELIDPQRKSVVKKRFGLF